MAKLTSTTVFGNLTVTGQITGLQELLDGKEPVFSKNTAFNRDFAGSGSASTVARSDHDHASVYEPRNTNIQSHIASTDAHVTVSDKTAWNAKEDAVNRGAANGYAALDANGKIPLTQIPDTARQQTYIRSLETDLSAISGMVSGDRAFITGTGDSYVYDGSWWLLTADADWANVSLDWNNITNAPDTFTPEWHGNHVPSLEAANSLRYLRNDNTWQDITGPVRGVVAGMVDGSAESGIAVSYNSTTNKLDFNVKDPTIALDGDVTGSAVMTDLGSVVISTTVQDNSHAHTASNISDLQSLLDAKADTHDHPYDLYSSWTLAVSGETYTDAIASGGTVTLVSGDNVLIQRSAANEITISAEALSKETIQDYVGEMVSGNSETGLSVAYDDAANKFDFSLNYGGSGAATSVARSDHSHSSLVAIDDRDVKPDTTGIGAGVKGVKAFFTSLGGMTGAANSDYQDLLVLDTYGDDTGGNTNGLLFDKSTKRIRHYQAGQSAASWGTPRSLAYTDDDITGNAATATRLETARTLALSGDVTGSAAFDGSGNVTITAVVGDDSHTHDTRYYTQTQVDGKIAALVDTAPGTLDTLNELAAALGDDPNFATTVTNQIAAKQNQLTGISDVPGLVTALGGKSDTGHDHTGTYLPIGGKAADAYKLDGHDSSYFAAAHSHPYLNLSGGTLTGNLTISKGGSAGSGVGETSGAASIVLADPNNNQNVEISHDPFDSSIPEGTSGYGVWIRRAASNVQSEYKTGLYVEGEIYADSTQRVWHAGNVGSGSGLDADKLDGHEATYFAVAHGHPYLADTHAASGVTTAKISTWDTAAGRVNQGVKTTSSPSFVGGSFSGDLTVSGTITAQNAMALKIGEGLEFLSGAGYFGSYYDARIIRMVDLNGSNGSVDGGLVVQSHTSSDGLSRELLRIRMNEFKYKGNTVWHAGNDGSGSGLDADKLDGHDSSYFAPAHSHPYLSSSHDAAGVTSAKITTWDTAAGRVNQDLKTTAAPTFAGAVLNGLGYLSKAGLEFKDNAGHLLTLGQDEYTTPNDGVCLRPLTNPADGEAILTVRSEGYSPRLIVEHNGAVKTSNPEMYVGVGTDGTGGNKVWHAGNDGSGSGLDADKLDGHDSSYFAVDGHTHDTRYYTQTQVDGKIAALVDTAPGTLDTLNELASALGDDPNFATTVTNQIAAKQDQLTGISDVPGLVTALSGKSDTGHAHDDRYYTKTQLTNYTVNPRFSSSIGFGNDTEVIRFNDATNETLTGYWSAKDGLYLQGDGNSVDSVVVKTGNLSLSQNAHVAGKVRAQSTVIADAVEMVYNATEGSLDFVFA